MASSVDQFRYLGICIGSLVCVVGTVGNLMTVLAYATNPRMRTAFNLLIVNLAVVDFILSTSVLPLIIYGYSNKEWPFSAKSCEVFAYFYYALHYTSAVNLLTISFNRYMHVSRPHAAYRIMFSKKKRRLAGLLIWIFAPLLLLPLIFTSGFGWWPDGLMCAFTRQGGFADIYSLVMRVLFQFVPLFGMVILYTLIFHTVKKSHSNVDNPRIIAEQSDGSLNSVGVSASGNGKSINNNSDYQLRLSHSPTTTSAISRTPTKTPADDKRLWRQNSTKPSVILSPIHSEVLHELPVVISDDKLRSHSDNGAQNAVLGRKFVRTRHATLCRAATSGDLLNKRESNLARNTPNASGPRHVTLTKARSVTFSDFHAVQRRLDYDKDCDSDDFFVETKRSGRALERPRSLNFRKPRRPQDGVNAKSPGLLAPPTIKRSLSVSLNSLGPTKMRQRLNSMMDLVKPKEVTYISLRDARRKFSRSSQVQRRTSIQHAKAQRQLLYMSTVICATFAFCVLPSLILNLVGSYNNIEPEFFMAASNLAWLTSMINPIVYAAMNVQFRKEYSRVMQKLADCVWPRQSKVYPIKTKEQQANLQKTHFSA